LTFKSCLVRLGTLVCWLVYLFLLAMAVIPLVSGGRNLPVVLALSALPFASGVRNMVLFLAMAIPASLGTWMARTERCRRIGLCCLVLPLLISFASCLQWHRLKRRMRSTSAEVEVDFSRTESPASMMGFLHGVEDTEQMPDEWVKPLFAAPVSWRVRGYTEIVDRAHELGVEKPIVVVTDTWNGKAPALDWQAWEEHVRSVARQFGSDVIYDIINEPDMPFFWRPHNGHHFPSGWADLHETFHRAHDVIRQELGAEALISGPSFSLLWESEKRLYDFFRFCHENELIIQILSVHVLYQPDATLPLVSASLQKYRRDFIESGDYEGAGVKYIHVNEYGLPDDYTRPGTIVATLRHLELGGADAANRAIWPGRTEDIRNTVDGYLRLVMPESSNAPVVLSDVMFSYDEPRPVWWAYRYYASGVASRVHAHSSSAFLMPVASAASDIPDQAQLIIGATASTERAAAQEIDLKLRHLEELSFIDANTDMVDIEVKRIVNDETSPLLSLPTVLRQQVAISDGETELRLPPLGDYEAYVVLIQGLEDIPQEEDPVE